jgi:hypothetical protein
MSIKYICIIFLFFNLLASGIACADTSDSSAYREGTIGGFDFNSKLLTEKALINLYGKGCVDKYYPNFYSRIYYFPSNNVYAAFNIETDNMVAGLKITKENIVSKRCLAKQELKSFRTGKNISLGNSGKDIIGVYGKPSKVTVKSKGVKLYEYYLNREEGPVMFITTVHDSVVSIYITVGD